MEKNKLKTIKSRYEKLKSAGKLEVRKSKGNLLNSPLMDSVKESFESQVDFKTGLTVVPLDGKTILENSQTEGDFAHKKDKLLRSVEIYTLSKLFPNKIKYLNGFYGVNTTNILREHFERGKHFKIELNKELNEIFISVDISELIK